MAHDHNGRVGPPRCEECNAPLNSDDRRLGSLSPRSLCLDCHLERNPFPRVTGQRSRKRKGRPHIGLRRGFELRAGSFVVSSFEGAIPNSEVEPLVRP